MTFSPINLVAESVVKSGKILQQFLIQWMGILVTLKSVRDRFSNLMRKYKAKNNKEIKSFEIGGEEPTEYDTLLEDLIELSDECDLKHELAAEEKKNSAAVEQKKAVDVRQLAMERMSETKKRNNDENEEPTSSKRNRRSTSKLYIDFLRQKWLMIKNYRSRRKQRDVKKLIFKSHKLIKQQICSQLFKPTCNSRQYNMLINKEIFYNLLTNNNNNSKCS